MALSSSATSTVAEPCTPPSCSPGSLLCGAGESVDLLLRILQRRVDGLPSWSTATRSDPPNRCPVPRDGSGPSARTTAPPRGDVMSTLLYRLAHWCVRRRRIVLAAWLTALIGAVALAVVADGEASSAFEMPGTESQAAAELLVDRFPSESDSTAQLAFTTSDGPSSDVARKITRRN